MSNNERTEWLNRLNVGDVVIVVSGEHMGNGTVTHITPTRRIRVAVGHRLIEFNADGSERHGGSKGGYYSNELHAPDSPLVTRLAEKHELRNLQRTLENTGWRTITDAELLRRIVLMLEDARR